MATFYGGEQLASVERFLSEITPTNNQQFDIYTVPAGHYAVLKKYAIARVDSFQDISMHLVLQHSFSALQQFPFDNVNSSSFVRGIYSEIIASLRSDIEDVGSTNERMQNQMNRQRSYDQQQSINESRASVYRDAYLSEGDKIRFESYNNNNNVPINYFVEIHVFKKP